MLNTLAIFSNKDDTLWAESAVCTLGDTEGFIPQQDKVGGETKGYSSREGMKGGKDGDGKPGCVKDILCEFYPMVYPPGLQQIRVSA